jgi:hypothetical protein
MNKEYYGKSQYIQTNPLKDLNGFNLIEGYKIVRFRRDKANLTKLLQPDYTIKIQ